MTSNPAAIPDSVDAVIATFAEVRSKVEASSDSPEAVSVWLQLAGQPVRLTVVGRTLAQRLLLAYRHLLFEPSPEVLAEPGGAALEIEVWDETACGRSRPIRYLRDCVPHSRPFGRAVLGFNDSRSIMGYQSHSLFGLLDLENKRLVAAVDNAEGLSLFERGKPLQPLLFAWHGAIGAAPVHAGLVSKNGSGVLLGGAGGSGKSTTSLLCWQAGFDYLGDDYIALPKADEGGVYTGHSLYTSTWLTPEHSQRFPRLAARAHVGDETDDKLLVLLNEVDDRGLTQSSRIDALLLPRVVGGRETSFRPASRAEALFRLAPSSILQLPFIEPQAALDRMSELLDTVPSFWLDLGTDFSEIPKAVERVLDEVHA